MIYLLLPPVKIPTINKITNAPMAPVSMAFTNGLAPILTLSSLNNQCPTKLPRIPTTTFPISPNPFPL